MRLLVSGGGTGGHIYPALALARHVLACEPESEVLFIGTADGLESKIIPAEGFFLETISARGYPRRLTKLVPVIKESISGTFQVRKIIKDFKPQVVVGTGGYVSAPVVLAAAINRVPAVIHEQNAIPGMANRYLAPLASRICLSFESSRIYFRSSKKTVVTGNPRSSEAASYSKAQGRKRFNLHPDHPVVVAFGGSRGALKLNRVITEYLSSGWWLPNVQLIYVAGEIYYRQVKEQLSVLPPNISLFPYLQEMPAALAAADLVITRSGATTLAEITALGIPAILVPSPNVVDNHQHYNARVMADCGAAILIEERELTAYRLRKELSSLLSNADLLNKMGQASRNLGIVDSADRVYRCLQQ
ncbi:MAG TPA: undecaprenyldiphospho-muramoylpentapeptide beta-N-acetylglucosaminyltransferase, partial [Firmicutes bacterium]|nr:undecaprenyldiphospho-muramoylpentapeptide beta-N-acetylglucosaminyltransferase [Bacillota bacterium]